MRVSDGFMMLMVVNGVLESHSLEGDVREKQRGHLLPPLVIFQKQCPMQTSLSQLPATAASHANATLELLHINVKPQGFP